MSHARTTRGRTWSIRAAFAVAYFAFGAGTALAKQGAPNLGQWSVVYNLDTSLEEGELYDEGLTAEIAHAALLPPSNRDEPVTRVLLVCEPNVTCPGGLPIPGEKFGRAYVWKPGRPTVARAIAVPTGYPVNGSQDFFCGGHTFLADGSLLFPSGTNVLDTCIFGCDDDGFYGHEFAWRLITSGETLSWVAAGEMQWKRWYPTVTLLDTGNAVVNGHEFCPHDGQGVERDEYVAASGTWSLTQTNLGSSGFRVGERS